jgi:hypothetical protein
MKKFFITSLLVINASSFAAINDSSLDNVRQEFRNVIKEVTITSRKSPELKKYLEQTGKSLTQDYINLEKLATVSLLEDLKKETGISLKKTSSNYWEVDTLEVYKPIYLQGVSAQERAKHLVESAIKSLETLRNRVRVLDQKYFLRVSEHFQNKESLNAQIDALKPLISDLNIVKKSVEVRDRFEAKYGIKVNYDATTSRYFLDSAALKKVSGYLTVEAMDSRTKKKYKKYFQEFSDAFYDLGDVQYLTLMSQEEFLFILDYMP